VIERAHESAREKAGVEARAINLRTLRCHFCDILRGVMCDVCVCERTREARTLLRSDFFSVLYQRRCCVCERESARGKVREKMKGESVRETRGRAHK